ncbi:MAG: hypothetical protein IT466_05445 [Moraxellaceae bacterium]|nr:hypothetical protein [Moraxellaceae bacterium]
MKKKNKMKLSWPGVLTPLATCLLGMATPVLALEALDEQELSAVHAQDGLTVNVSSAPGITAQQVNLMVDAGTADAATLNMQGISMRGVSTTGVVGGPFNATATLDVGANAAGTPVVAINLNTELMRLRVDDLRLGDDATRSFGTMAVDGKIAVSLLGEGGIFNNATTQTYLKGEITDGAIYYRGLWHQHPYLILNNLHAMWEMEAGALGITNEGIRMSTIGTASPYINVALDFDLLYKFPLPDGNEPVDFMVTGQESPILHFGWLGSLRDAELKWSFGGSWTGYTPYNLADVSGGLRLSSKWNFVDNHEAVNVLGKPEKEFRWQLGEAAREGTTGDKTRVNLELSDWTAWGSAPYAHDFPLIAMDVINSNQGPGGLCWGSSTDAAACGGGGQFVNLTPGTVSGYSAAVNRTNADSIALMVRDGQFMTYSRKIKLLERDSSGALVNLVGGAPRSFNWGLIFTMANIDGNVYLYPGNGDQGDVAGGSENRGIMADVMLMSQSFANGCDIALVNCSQVSGKQNLNWDKGTHLMIADTDVNGNGTTGESRDAMGIGLVSSSFLLLADDARVAVRQTATNDYWRGGIDIMSPRTRFNFKGIFGGGILPDDNGGYDPAHGQEVVAISVVNINLEGMINLRLSPSAPVTNAPRNFIGFSGALRLQDTDIAGFSESTSADTVDDGTFISLAEPSDAAIDLRFSRITGDIAIVNGRMDLRGTNEDNAVGYAGGGDGKPKLVIDQTIQFGATAAARMTDGFGGVSLASPGQAFEIGRVEFGGQTLGRIVISSGQLYTSFSLKPQ